MQNKRGVIGKLK